MSAVIIVQWNSMFCISSRHFEPIVKMVLSGQSARAFWSMVVQTFLSQELFQDSKAHSLLNTECIKDSVNSHQVRTMVRVSVLLREQPHHLQLFKMGMLTLHSGDTHLMEHYIWWDIVQPSGVLVHTHPLRPGCHEKRHLQIQRLIDVLG